MTYKEAKLILDPKTTEEALSKYDKPREAVDEACEVACKALDIVDQLELIQEGQMAKLP